MRAKRLSLLIAIALAAAGFVAAPAQAVGPLCGNSTVHGTITLHADADCGNLPDGAILNGNATIKLNGHNMQNGTGTAIENPGPFKLTILGPGKILNFRAAVDSHGRTTISRVTFSNIDPPGTPEAVVEISGAPKSNVSRNVFSANNPGNNASFVLELFSSPKSKVLRNTFVANKALDQAVWVDGDRTVVKGNTITDRTHDVNYSDANEGLFVSGDRTKVIKNRVSGFGANGLRIDSSHVGKIQLKKNHTDGNGVGGVGSGVFIENNSGKVFLQRNESSNNSNYGYELESGVGDANVRFKKKHNTGTGNTNGLCSPNLC